MQKTRIVQSPSIQHATRIAAPHNSDRPPPRISSTCRSRKSRSCEIDDTTVTRSAPSSSTRSVRAAFSASKRAMSRRSCSTSLSTFLPCARTCRRRKTCAGGIMWRHYLYRRQEEERRERQSRRLLVAVTEVFDGSSQDAEQHTEQRSGEPLSAVGLSSSGCSGTTGARLSVS